MAALVMVRTGAHIWTLNDGTPHPTGFWVDEFVFPHRIFMAAGINVKVAMPSGVTPAGDELSLPWPTTTMTRACCAPHARRPPQPHAG